MAEYIDFKRKIETTKHRIESSEKITPHNQKILFRFLQFMEGKGLSDARIDRALDLARIYAESLHPKKLDHVTKTDIVKLCGSWEKSKNARTGQPWTPSTISTYKATLKSFYTWLLGKNNDQTSWVSSTIKQVDTEVINPNTLFSEDDIKKLIDNADDISDKAFVACFYDSACRPEEYITLKIGDVIIDGSSVKLRISRGKTGQRFVHLTVFPNYLTTWLNYHPLKDDKNAPLWITRSNNSRNQPLTYAAARDFFRQLCLKTFYPEEWEKIKQKPHQRRIRDGVNLSGRRFSMYNLRHSRATQLVKLGVKIQVLQRHLGHSKVNRTQIYTHLDDKDIATGLREAQGEVVEEDLTVSKLRPRICGRCSYVNSATIGYCGRCGSALTLKEAQANLDAQKAAIQKSLEAEAALATVGKAKYSADEIRAFIQEELAKKERVENENSNTV